ncbi:DUF711 family protein [Acidianus sulfidivorans JP7]|uniref:DUF711 domain-containing protein n=1 Tax=Acidianus sulfidivorans JP7 TaxID=619593 RepID=A0A2U9INZ9_9CREN|nr:DUF711 family protein [Acidianus sulfidivorans]AWR97704.1 DUF711 family protein [Acidianus sulfidivorans JP7]
MKIRAITAFAASIDKNSLDELEQKIENIKVDTLTKRISLPETPKNIDLGKIMDMINGYNNDIIYSIVSLKQNDPRIFQIKDILSSSEKVYANVLIKNDNIENIAKLITKLEPSEASRFALLINDDFLMTPYFPTSTANVIRDSFALSLIYVKDVIEGKGIISLQKADEIGKKIQKDTNIKYLGIDISLSPWGEESVGDAIEKKSSKIFSRGNIWAVGELNRLIFSLAWNAKVTPIGYSETMLPVGEDEILTKRVEENSLNLSQLISLTFACAAGLDMVGIQEDEELYKNIIKDSIAIQFTKRRPYGIRIIPSRGEEKIYIKEFGIIPTIKVV